MADWSRQVASTSGAEVVVCGCGTAAFSAALAARAEGRQVLLCGPGPALVDEVTVSLAGDLPTSPTDEHLARLVARVESVGGLRDGWLDGPLTEMAADRLLAEAGVQVLLYVQPVAIVGGEAGAQGVLLAGKHGLELVSAGSVVDATADGALFAASGVDFLAPESVTVGRSAYLQFCGEDLRGLPDEVNGMALAARHTQPGEVRLTVTTDAPYDGLPVPDEAAVTTRAAVEAVARVARTACPALATAAVSHTGHRPLALNVRRTLTDGPAHPRWANVFGAGAWVHGDRPGDLDRLAVGGTQAGALAAAQARQPMGCTTTAEVSAERGTVDVVVAGGGTGGAVAALAAARLGASVLVYEAGQFCGGIGTGGGIHVYYHGVRGGLQDGIDEATERIGEALGGRERFVGFSPEAKKIAFECALAGDGVDVRYEWTVADVVVRDGRVAGVVAARPGLLEYQPCACVVDGTGDGDVAALAGAPMTHGRDSDGVAHAYSQSCGTLQGERISFTNFDAGYVDATDPDDLTRARRFGIQVYWRDEPCPPGERLLYLAPLLGLRQSRHAVTDYVVTLADQSRGASFADDVAYGRCHYDNHAFDYENESDEARFWCWTLGRWRDHMRHGVPYRSLLPQGIDGLVMGSRALGVSHDAHMLFRMQRDMQRIGEAAGAAAALAARGATTPRALGAEPVRAALAATGALLSDWDSAVVAPAIDELVPALAGDGARTASWQLYLAGAAAVEPLVGVLAAESAQARWYAAATLAMLGRGEGVGELRRALAQRDETRPMSTSDTHHAERSAPRWKSAIGLLGQVGDREAVPLLAGVLADPAGDADALVGAVRALGRIGSAEALAALEAYGERLETGEDVPEAYLQLSMGGGRRLPRDIAWFVRSALVEALSALGADHRHLLDGYLDDERAWVRGRAVQLNDIDPAARLRGSGEAARLRLRH
ncbi:MAG: FAD-dependent oxidoreductase [Armatimonadetes bacterium]|nr:FAD-dependent oxidoreductase [Armatimonadota bacterium]